MYLSIADSQDNINLLAAVGSPLPPDVRPVTGPFGRYGRPAVEFTPQSYIGRWAKDLLPIPFYKDFGIKVTIFLQSIYGGVLFNVLEYDHSKVVLGLNIIQVDNTQQAIEFIYKNSPNVNGMSQELSAVFTVPRFDRRWTVFSLTVHGQEVTLYLNGCEKIMTAAFKVSRTTLDLRENAPIFIGMPGWYIKKPALFVSIIFHLSVTCQMCRLFSCLLYLSNITEKNPEKNPVDSTAEGKNFSTLCKYFLLQIAAISLETLIGYPTSPHPLPDTKGLECLSYL